MRHLPRRRLRCRTRRSRRRIRQIHRPPQPITELPRVQPTSLRGDRRLHPRHILIGQNLSGLSDLPRLVLIDLPSTQRREGRRQPGRQRHGQPDPLLCERHRPLERRRNLQRHELPITTRMQRHEPRETVQQLSRLPSHPTRTPEPLNQQLMTFIEHAFSLPGRPTKPLPTNKIHPIEDNRSAAARHCAREAPRRGTAARHRGEAPRRGTAARHRGETPRQDAATRHRDKTPQPSGRPSERRDRHRHRGRGRVLDVGRVFADVVEGEAVCLTVHGVLVHDA